MSDQDQSPDDHPDQQPDDQSEHEPEGRSGKAARESLAVPVGLRLAVDERDQQLCRVCGRWLGGQRAIHHIHYGGDRTGMGGRRQHDLDNLISICWMGPGNCHDLVHSSKRIWLPLLEATIASTGVTAMQLRRWQQRRGVSGI